MSYKHKSRSHSPNTSNLRSRDASPDRSRSNSRNRSTSRLPSINERLAYLRPSRELLEYYRKKIAEFDDDRDMMINRLDKYKETCAEQHQMEHEMRQREDEISELQKALSDMQVYLFQEREQVLRLYAENDRLKIRELDDRKKINTLLSLSGVTENEVSYFIKEPPARAIIPCRVPKPDRSKDPLQQSKPSTSQLNMSAAQAAKNKAKDFTDEKQTTLNRALQLQVDALQAQLEEQTKLSREQINGLLEDRRIKTEEYESARLRDQQKIKSLTDKLHKAQDLLHDSTKDFLNVRFDHRDREKLWMREKEQLLQQLDSSHQQLSRDRLQANTPVICPPLEESISQLDEFVAVEHQWREAEKLAELYRDQVVQLEDSLSKVREEGDVGKELFKLRCEKMAKHLDIMNKRYQELERRRNLEVEGFKTDIKQLRSRLKDVEKQLYKITIGYADEVDMTQRPDDIDMQMLRNVRKTASRSAYLVDELKTLKSKVYGLQNDLKHL